ncbi:hypothetical protein V6N11_018358 [Hibiscus sabdariffa]|uniref:F-box domain-containing protein n=1 Tax=Hibiscus sabdariffa TaxID=183260 RepID=A0ABR2T764_9ROSI
MLPREVLLDRFHLRSWDQANLSFTCKKHYALSTNSCTALRKSISNRTSSGSPIKLPVRHAQHLLISLLEGYTSARRTPLLKRGWAGKFIPEEEGPRVLSLEGKSTLSSRNPERWVHDLKLFPNLLSKSQRPKDPLSTFNYLLNLVWNHYHYTFIVGLADGLAILPSCRLECSLPAEDRGQLALGCGGAIFAQSPNLMRHWVRTAGNRSMGGRLILLPPQG